MKKVAVLLIASVLLVGFVAVYVKHAEACCGLNIDIWELNIVGGECDTAAEISGQVYAQYWTSGYLGSLVMWIEITDSGGTTVRTLTTAAGEISTAYNFTPQTTVNVDDDGLVRGNPQGLVDEDGSYGYGGATNVDDDGDGWIDEDASYGQFANWTYGAVWDGKDGGGNPVPDGNYTAVVSAQVGGMNTSAAQDLVTRGCCADLQAVEYAWGPGGYSFPNPTTFQASNIVKFENVGTDDAYNATASVVEVPPNVTIVDADVTLGDIPAGGSVWSSDDFSLQVDLANPSDPNAMMYWDVSYDEVDAAGNVIRTCIIRKVPKFPGEP